jgi:L-asparaginase II
MRARAARRYSRGMSNPVLVEAWRGDAVESIHRGALAVVDADGALVASLGDIERPVFPRSAVKLLQALPLVASGTADRLALSDEELALACASHTGEPTHTATAASMLAKAGLDVQVLECGCHWPTYEPAARALAAAGELPSALHNNCSGKHAGFACLATTLAGSADARGWLRGYVRAEHALMREVSAAVQAATGADLARLPVGTDGCSIPTHAQPLAALALGYARVGSGIGLAPAHARAAVRLRCAVAAAPWHASGSGRFDARIGERLRERVYCKVGAEGVYCAALPERGFGIAIKMDDGNTARAVEVVMAAVIEALLPLGDDDRSFVHGASDLRLVNWNGLVVGRLAATDTLRSALAI